MLIVRYAVDGEDSARVGVSAENGALRRVAVPSLAELLALDTKSARALVDGAGDPVGASVRILPPIDGFTEVWASGVTYRRSQEARIEESQVANVYALIYEAERPELFFKSVAWRVVGDGELIGIREDSKLNVPEPELALVINSSREVFGYTVCNDVSSRSLEGENPLYLPQAKIYAGSCSLGPGIRPAWELSRNPAFDIHLEVRRSDAVAWAGQTTTRMMRRRFEELAEYLFRADQFPQGAVLSTGTGIVPEMDFSLERGDTVRISIGEIGTLSNRVSLGPRDFAPLQPQRTTAHSRPLEVEGETP